MISQGTGGTNASEKIGLQTGLTFQICSTTDRTPTLGKLAPFKEMHDKIASPFACGMPQHRVFDGANGVATTAFPTTTFAMAAVGTCRFKSRQTILALDQPAGDYLSELSGAVPPPVGPGLAATWHRNDMDLALAQGTGLAQIS